MVRDVSSCDVKVVRILRISDGQALFSVLKVGEFGCLG